MSIPKKISPLLLIISIVTLLLLSACGGNLSGNGTTSNTPSSSTAINVVAAENFYGDLVKQLGGSHVAVTSILSNPNVDPHQYESNVQTAIAVSKAQLIIENGAAYDTWMDKLLSASPNSDRIVLVSADIADHKLPENPHVWYGIDNMSTIAQAITGALVKLDAADTPTFDKNLATFKQSLVPLEQKISDIKKKYKGIPVALTETIYLYQTMSEGLNVLTPFEFQKAIAEGTDPPANTVVETNTQVSRKEVKILIYNMQTVTPITTNLQNEAKNLNIPVVPVSETMPPGKTYQTWMMDQLNTLQLALAKATGH
ncbi:MAG TPA: zinc ABC transporter substrate-binding protein [Ktedonobacteraceae bacterium]|nr:zinc ABC transporter substrate-binding protein [Ktedonobacteraceae bacterium]